MGECEKNKQQTKAKWCHLHHSKLLLAMDVGQHRSHHNQRVVKNGCIISHKKLRVKTPNGYASSIGCLVYCGPQERQSREWNVRESYLKEHKNLMLSWDVEELFGPVAVSHGIWKKNTNFIQCLKILWQIENREVKVDATIRQKYSKYQARRIGI